MRFSFLFYFQAEFNSTFASPSGAAGKDSKKNQLRSILPVTAETVNLATQVEGENSVFEYNHLRFHNVSETFLKLLFD